MLIVALPVVLLLFWLHQYFGIYGQIAYIIVGAILFKATFAIKSMGYYTRPIAKALKKDDLEGARKWLPYIVRRDPSTPQQRQIISAAVESIAESTTDGITAPFFFLQSLGCQAPLPTESSTLWTRWLDTKMLKIGTLDGSAQTLIQ